VSKHTTQPPTTEAVLFQAKVKRLSNVQLAEEIKRCHAGLMVATSKGAVVRLETRIRIMQEEADLRMGGVR
jgi:hypothetical protein